MEKEEPETKEKQKSEFNQLLLKKLKSEVITVCTELKTILTSDKGIEILVNKMNNDPKHPLFRKHQPETLLDYNLSSDERYKRWKEAQSFEEAEKSRNLEIMYHHELPTIQDCITKICLGKEACLVNFKETNLVPATRILTKVMLRNSPLSHLSIGVKQIFQKVFLILCNEMQKNCSLIFKKMHRTNINFATIVTQIKDNNSLNDDLKISKIAESFRKFLRKDMIIRFQELEPLSLNHLLFEYQEQTRILLFDKAENAHASIPLINEEDIDTLLSIILKNNPFEEEEKNMDELIRIFGMNSEWQKKCDFLTVLVDLENNSLNQSQELIAKDEGDRRTCLSKMFLFFLNKKFGTSTTMEK